MLALYVGHKQKPSVWHTILGKMNEYLKSRHAADPSMPSTLQKWQADYFTKLVVNGPTPGQKDDVKVGIPWGAAFFIDQEAQCLKDVITFLDGFVHWRTSGQSNESKTFPGIPVIHISLPCELEGLIHLSSEDVETAEKYRRTWTALSQ